MFDLSNFYKDYSNDLEIYSILNVMYEGLMDYLVDYAKQVEDNTIIPKVETYRVIPFQAVETEEAAYDLGTLLSTKSIVTLLGVGNVSLEERIDRWTNPQNPNKFSVDRKLKALDMAGTYILMMAKRNDTLDQSNALVVDLKIFNEKGEELIRDNDFVLLNNRIYLFGDAAKKVLGRIFTMKDICVDFNTPESLIGKNVDVLYNNILTKNEYREIVQMFLYASLGGPTIKNIRNAISTVSGLKGVQVFDKYTADATRQQYWTATDRPDRLHEFDFLISLPDEYLEDADKLKIFMEYLKIVKPVYTQFYISTLHPVLDVLILRSKDRRDIKPILNAYDFLSSIDYTGEYSVTAQWKDIINKIETTIFATHTATKDKMNKKDTIDSLKFIFDALQNGGPFDKILVNAESNNRKVTWQAKDIALSLGTRTLWQTDDGVCSDEAFNTLDNFDNFNYNQQCYTDRINIILHKM